MILSRVTVVIGESKELIERGSDNLIADDKNKATDIEVIKFPECYKHPKLYTKELKGRLLKDVKERFIILSFSEDVLNLLGHMIYKNLLLKEEVEVYIFNDVEVRKSNYDVEGFLENYPPGYLSWSE